MKVRLRERARALGIPVVMETSDRGLLDIERFDLEPQRPLFHGLGAGGLTIERQSLELFSDSLIAGTSMGIHRAVGALKGQACQVPVGALEAEVVERHVLESSVR